MNRVLLMVFIYALPCLVFGKNDLPKQEKAIVKALKKQYKLEDVDIKRPYSGFTYYELMTKDFKRMIADSTGQVIIPQSKLSSDAYQNSIKFVQGHTKGYDNFRRSGRNLRNTTAYYPGNESVFVANKHIGGGANEYEFFSSSGELLNTFDGNISESLSAPVNICKDMAGYFGVMTMDGKILLPCEYNSIEVRANGICTFMQMKNGMDRMGGACISDITESTVPCNFHYVEYSQSDRCWKVQIHKFDSLIVYDESRQYNTSFLDEGQRLFEQRQYEEVQKYYTLTADNAIWAKFYIGATYYISAQRLCDSMNDALVKLERSHNRFDRHIATDIQGDMGLFRSEAEKAGQAFHAYLEVNHTQYAAKAKEFLYELDKMLTSVAGMENRLKMALSDFDRRCSDLERIEQEEYNRRIEQQQLNLERERINEQRLAREQREREMRMRQGADAERRQREAKKREEEKRKAPQNQQQGQQQQNQQKQRQWTQQRQLPAQLPQHKMPEQKNKELKDETKPSVVPKKKIVVE